MPEPISKIVLGSRSPRRRDLLRLIVPEERIVVLPPRDSDEPGFEDVPTWRALEDRLMEIAEGKSRDVLEQVRQGRGVGVQRTQAVVTADTVIAAGTLDERPVVLGQPETQDHRSWQAVVRRWFEEYYAGHTHVALTAFCVTTLSGRSVRGVARSEVTFRSDVGRWLDWYLRTGEPLGKAGGYGIQGAADVFIARVDGSISNVVGLPLRELLDAFEELGLDLDPPSLV
ncbi:MAG: Maf-like protein [Planctomycetes bacterium]|nr:Maf-like protein [Planctomycetota bacterium]